MRLHYHPFSSNARKATMTAQLLHSPVELVLVDLAKGEQRSPAFRKLNPNGKVPVLEDGSFVLWESGAIMLYLAEKSPDKRIYPADVAARADIHRWMFWSTAHFTPPIGVLNFEHILKPLFGLGAPDPAAVKRAEGELLQYGQVLDDHLASRRWLSGEGLTLADVSIACPLMTAEPAKLPVKTFAHVQRWLGEVQALDAWKNTEPPR